MTERVDWAAMLAWLSACVDTDERVAQTLAGLADHDIGDLDITRGRVIEPYLLRFGGRRLLAEVAAKRAMLADWQQQRDKVAEFYARPDAELHANFAHPDYEYATTEGQRKAWDHSDEPPWGDNGPDHTWERNVDAGRDGWERFDYTEESYWRRLLPEDKRGSREPEPPRHIRHMVTAYRHEPGYQPEWAPEADRG